MRKAWLFYLVLIFGLSSIHGSTISLDPGHKDKVMHFILFGGFGFVIAWGGRRSLRWDWHTTMLVGLGAAALTGLADELYQMLIPGRQSTVGDWVADVMGGGAGAMAARAMLLRLRNRPEKES